MKPDWTRFRRGAGLVRNREMSEYPDAAIIFWDGVSRGTSDIINHCKNNGLEYTVIQY